MTTDIQKTAAQQGAPLPFGVMLEVVNAVVETCRIQMDLELDVEAQPTDPRKAQLDFGSSVVLESETDTWRLAVMCNRPGGEGLTRSLFAMEGDEELTVEDLADALAEITNVAAGVLKASRAAAGQKVRLCRPLFMDGNGCSEFFAGGSNGLAQTLRGPQELQAHVILIWQSM